MRPELSPDFGAAAKDYGKYRAGFPDSFFERLSKFGIGAAGQRVLDLGTGTGTIARGLAVRGCRVTGLDHSIELVEEAIQLDRKAGVRVEYVVATAEETGLPDDSFDVVAAGQCWHWFDRKRATLEVQRVLKPGGRLVIAHFDWLPLPDNAVEATEKLIEKHNPRWNLGGGSGLHPDWLGDVAVAGFREIETFSFDLPVIYSHEAWRGRVRASAGVSGSLAAQDVVRFDQELESLLKELFPDDPLTIPHRIFAVVSTAV